MTKNEQGMCATRNCQERIHAQGLCPTHYRPVRAAQAFQCVKSHCNAPRHADNLCRSHYAKARRAA